MGANIITGYTGTRHITPAMDAAVYRSTFGPDSYILSDGNQLAGSMPSVNEFTVLDGLVSMQGHQIQVTQETLSVDTCANGYKRIDLVCMRFEHDNNSQVDSASLIVIKGTEVADPNDPVVPDYNEGDIDSGASVVDFPLYQINLAGATVAFTQLAEVVKSTIENLPSIVEQNTSGIWFYRKWSDGTIECRGIAELANKSVTSVLNSVFYAPLDTIDLPTDLFTEINCAHTTLTDTNGNGSWFNLRACNNTRVLGYIYSPKSHTATFRLNITVVGK